MNIIACFLLIPTVLVCVMHCETEVEGSQYNSSGSCRVRNLPKYTFPFVYRFRGIMQTGKKMREV
jgi:hypothetical protein